MPNSIMLCYGVYEDVLSQDCLREANSPKKIIAQRNTWLVNTSFCVIHIPLCLPGLNKLTYCKQILTVKMEGIVNIQSFLRGNTKPHS